jgi:hypothetical protein
MIGFTSCKSDSAKMIEKCNAHIAAVDSIHNKADFDKFTATHPNCLGDFYAAIKKDSIYAKQDLTEALPQIFDAVYKTLDKQERVFLADCPNEPTAKAVTMIGMYVLKLPYCTKVSQLQKMAQELNSTLVSMTATYSPSQFSITVINAGNEWLQKALIRKTEIEEGNLYDSQYL